MENPFVVNPKGVVDLCHVGKMATTNAHEYVEIYLPLFAQVEKCLDYGHSEIVDPAEDLARRSEIARRHRREAGSVPTCAAVAEKMDEMH